MGLCMNQVEKRTIAEHGGLTSVSCTALFAALLLFEGFSSGKLGLNKLIYFKINKVKITLK
jgi:hypothetical protein